MSQVMVRFVIYIIITVKYIWTGLTKLTLILQPCTLNFLTIIIYANCTSGGQYIDTVSILFDISEYRYGIESRIITWPKRYDIPHPFING